MATNRGTSPLPTARRSRLATTNLKNSTKSNFRIQSAPPLSIQQLLRSATTVLPGAKDWRPSGKYRPPIYRAYLTPEIREKPKKHEPVWHPPGRYKEKPPTSLSPETKPVVTKKEPAWNPPGKFVPEQIPYFDAPSLRWSMQDLLRSMPDMRPKTCRSSTSMSTLRKSKEIQEI